MKIIFYIKLCRISIKKNEVYELKYALSRVNFINYRKIKKRSIFFNSGQDKWV